MAQTNLLWIGNADLFDPIPTSNITQAQANLMKGYTAAGSSKLAAVTVTGTTGYDSGNQVVYKMRYQSGYSKLTYTDPQGVDHTDITINTFVSASFDITTHDAEGNATVVRQSGVIMQMSNGDMFMRPSSATVPLWENIKVVSKVVVVNVGIYDSGVFASTHGFNVNIFDVEMIPCFTLGTMIRTSNGERAIESLLAGDLVWTRDHGFQPLRWLGMRRLSVYTLTAHPNLRPIRIRAGTLGAGTPASDLVVSPQHRVLVRSNIAQKMFGTDEVLVAAKQLLEVEGIEIATDVADVEYFHMLFDRHEVVISNGAETESLFTGPEALKSLGAAAVAEIFAIFPELKDPDNGPAPARPLVPGRKGRSLASRHAQNNVALVN